MGRGASTTRTLGCYSNHVIPTLAAIFFLFVCFFKATLQMLHESANLLPVQGKSKSVQFNLHTLSPGANEERNASLKNLFKLKNSTTESFHLRLESSEIL